MAANNTVLRSCIALPTGADRITIHRPLTAEIWHLHIGTHKLYIVGPGPGCMHAVSQAYYRGQVGTDEERDQARRACQILNTGPHRSNLDAGLPEILEAMSVREHIPASEDLVARAPVRTALKHALASAPLPRSRRAAAAESPVSDRAKLRTWSPTESYRPRFLAILDQVHRLTGVSPARILGNERSIKIANARTLAIGLTRKLCPGARLMQVGELFADRVHGTISKAENHHHLLLADSIRYAARHAAALDALKATPAAV